MSFQFETNINAPLQSWDIFCNTYNSLMADATKHQESVLAIKQIARLNKWSKQQTQEAIENIQQYVIVITDHLQKIAFTGKGFQEMTGYTFDEAKGSNETTEIILENYRKNGEIYLCKIIIKPVFNINAKLVNFIAYEQEIAA